MKVWAIELFRGANPLCVESLKEAAEILGIEEASDNHEVGEEIRITIREMSQEEYDSLPEWDGP